MADDTTSSLSEALETNFWWSQNHVTPMSEFGIGEDQKLSNYTENCKNGRTSTIPFPATICGYGISQDRAYLVQQTEPSCKAQKGDGNAVNYILKYSGDELWKGPDNIGDLSRDAYGFQCLSDPDPFEKKSVSNSDIPYGRISGFDSGGSSRSRTGRPGGTTNPFSLTHNQAGTSLLGWELGLCWALGSLISCVYSFQSAPILGRWTVATALLSLTLTFYVTACTVFWYYTGTQVESNRRVTLRLLYLRATQLYRYLYRYLLDEEISQSKSWMGRINHATFVAEQNAMKQNGDLQYRAHDWSTYRWYQEANKNPSCSGCKFATKALLVFTCGALGYFLILEERANFEGFAITMVPLCFNVWLSLIWLRLSFQPDGLSALLRDPVFASTERMGYCQNWLPNFTFSFWGTEKIKFNDEPCDPLSRLLDCYEREPPVLLWNPVYAVKECMDILENLVLLSWVFGLLLMPAYDLSMNHTNELSKWKSAGIVMLLTFAYYTSFLGGWFLVRRLCSTVCRKKFGPLCIALSILILTACFSAYALGLEASDIIVTLPQGFSLWLSLMWIWLRFHGIPRMPPGHESTTAEMQM